MDADPVSMDVDPSGGRAPEEWGSWDSLPADIVGTVLGFLPRLDDRASLRSVCRSWRAAARVQRPPPPLPLLVFPRSVFSSFSLTQESTVFRRFPRARFVAAKKARCVGAFGGWLVMALPSKQVYDADGECFLLNAFSRGGVRLPQPSAFHFFDFFRKSIPIANTSDKITCTFQDREYSMRFNKVVLSASPNSSSSYIVAAMATNKLALWRPGMKSWCVCGSKYFSTNNDMAFYKGKLYLVSSFSLEVLSLEFGEDDPRIIISSAELISRAQQGLIEALPPVIDYQLQKCNIVEWRERLLLVTRFGATWGDTTIKVGVFALDLSTNPDSITLLNSLDGDCLFISSCSCNSFPAYQYDEVEGDCVYFVNAGIQSSRDSPSFKVLVCNMRDDSLETFFVNGPDGNFDASKHSLVWFFPPQ